MAKARKRKGKATDSPSPNGKARPRAPDGWSDLASAKTEAVSWLWGEHVPFKHLTVLEGRKCSGKSTLLTAIASAITGGPALPLSQARYGLSVLWLPGEEDAETQLRPRLLAAGGDPRQVHYPRADDLVLLHALRLPSGCARLETAIKHVKPSLIVLDPWVSWIEPSIALTDEQSVRSVLAMLAGLARQYSCAMILVRHLRKSTIGPAVDHGLGSTAIGNAARVVLRVDDHPLQPKRKVLWTVASNLCRVGPGIEFELVDTAGYGTIRWHGETDLTRDQLSEGQVEAGPRDASADARRLLREVCSGQWVLAADVLREAAACGIGERTLRSAKAELSVSSRRRTVPGGASFWEWGLGAEDSENVQEDDQAREGGTGNGASTTSHQHGQQDQGDDLPAGGEARTETGDGAGSGPDAGPAL